MSTDGATSWDHRSPPWSLLTCWEARPVISAVNRSTSRVSRTPAGPHRSPNVATVRPDGTHLKFLTHFRGGRWGAFVGSWSPNGKWLVYRVENLESERYVLMLCDPDGSHRTRIASMPYRPRGTDWAARVRR